MRLVRFLYFDAWLFFTIGRLANQRSVILVTTGWTLIPAAAIAKSLGLCKWICALVDSSLAHTSDHLRWNMKDQGIPFPVARFIEGLARRADYVTVVNYEERTGLVASGFEGWRVKAAPLVMDDGVLSKTAGTRSKTEAQYNIPKGSKLVAFHGNLDFTPNRIAARRIVEFIAPETAKLKADVFFLIIGGGSSLGKLPPNVRQTGFVKDLFEVLCSVDIAIAPLEFGAGMKNKILDALRCQLPIIATPTGVSGFVPEESPIICAAIPQFPGLISRLLEDPNELKLRAEACRPYIEKYYSPERLNVYQEMVEKLAST